MPIRPEFRQFYGDEWLTRRDQILDRANHRCERCGKPDRQKVYVGVALPAFWYDPEFKRWRDGNGSVTAKCLWHIPQRRLVSVILTVAHLNHDPRDNRDENLAALCQRCHLLHDRKHHAATARRTRAARQRQMWLSFEIENAARPEGL
jgi:5-methylcytosine-specific restriction endonuclease McrA